MHASACSLVFFSQGRDTAALWRQGRTVAGIILAVPVYAVIKVVYCHIFEYLQPRMNGDKAPSC
ncbi:hypothetical protein [Aneurinibacillus aneurinilyticus]|uniref:Uncharacterized protein n=1 Tax=Aneurinibacillus aneurinilyticus ATCC 12856 TaxID=649747 RepID=U1WXV8_ANEAE|nr:hypothetical protein [Aneurinibacillus aneurinilyticus]ERI07525.1 hypothetical protein HMPREF0083_04397 [Aneurinibacillus aneurinilyticus ATCC 12856]